MQEKIDGRSWRKDIGDFFGTESPSPVKEINNMCWKDQNNKLQKQQL